MTGAVTGAGTTLDLARDTIFVTLAGSQAHGTAREGSDVDLRGVCVAPLALRVSLFSQFEQHEGALDGAAGLWDAILPRLRAHETARLGLSVKTESVVYDVAKFLGLCAAANPNALEILFADPRDWVHETPAWQRLYGARHAFLSRKVQQTYLGYAMAQLKKIRSHRGWLLSPPEKKPTREDFGLTGTSAMSADELNRIEQSIADRVRTYGIETLEMPRPLRAALHERLLRLFCDVLVADEGDLEARLRDVAIAGLRLPEGVTSVLAAERKYRTAQRQWESYLAWKAERNPARAELERAHGYDTKHAMHLLRLMQTGLELLQTGELRVRRANADELRAVRDGALSFDELVARARALEEAMREAAERSTLPADVDPRFVDELLVELVSLRLPKAKAPPGPASR